MYLSITNRLFRDWIREILVAIDEAEMHFTKEEVKVDGMDYSKTFAITSTFPAKMFDVYQISEEIVAGLRLQAIEDQLSLSDIDELLQIEYDKENEQFVFKVQSMVYEQRLLDANVIATKFSEGKNPFKNEKIISGLKGSFEIKGDVFRKVVNAAQKISDEIIIELVQGAPIIKANMEYEKETITEKTKKHSQKLETGFSVSLKDLWLKKTEQTSLNEAKAAPAEGVTCKSIYNIHYFVKMLYTINPDQKIRIKFFEGMPILIDTGITQYLLAPIV